MWSYIALRRATWRLTGINEKRAPHITFPNGKETLEIEDLFHVKQRPTKEELLVQAPHLTLPSPGSSLGPAAEAANLGLAMVRALTTSRASQR